MDGYQKIIKEKILENYIQVLIIDVESDKVYKYVNNNGEFTCENQSSYVDYFSACKDFIYEDDVQDYIDSLSISKLENSNSSITLKYKMFDNKMGSYMDYTNYISLYLDNGKKIIVVLVSRDNNGIVYEKTGQTKSDIEAKMKKVIDTVSLAMLKIHNVVNMGNDIRTKDEYINSILVALTTEFPELNKSFNDNAGEVYNSGKTTIMIIDDDKMTCNIIGKIFDTDYNVITAYNGREAIELLKKNRDNLNISCIFLDLIMPELNGFSVLDYLNDNNYLMKLPVIIISGNYDKETRNKAYSYSIADMLEKPFNAQVIRHRIENLINLYRASSFINEMMLEQDQNLKSIIDSIVTSYEIDNGKNINSLKKYMKTLAMQMSIQFPEYNISSNIIEKLVNAVSYYSIGSYTLPKSISNKNGNYNESEIELIKSSYLNGASIVKHVLSTNNKIDQQYCYEITKYYNEKYDGTGYPEGRSGNGIPLSAQIASLAIEYVRLINATTPVDYEKIASSIIMESGHRFNPKVVEAFKSVRTEFESISKYGG